MMKTKKFGFKLRKGAQVPPQHFINIAYAEAYSNSSPSHNVERENMEACNKNSNEDGVMDDRPKVINSLSSSISQDYFEDDCVDYYNEENG